MYKQDSHSRHLRFAFHPINGIDLYHIMYERYCDLSKCTRTNHESLLSVDIFDKTNTFIDISECIDYVRYFT